MSARSFIVAGLLLAIVCVAPALVGAAARTNKMKPPLIGEELNGKNRRSADCHFGKKVYELEDTWHPDLGSPFGVMYCIRCECIAVQKKRRIAGRTLCRNIKNECPKPNCDEPVLLPGRCCKVCLDEGAAALGPLKEDVSRAGADDDDRQAKDFAAVLTKKTTSATGSAMPDMATGRFTFQKRHLYYSIVVPDSIASGRTSPPRYLQFLSEDGNILEEQELATNDYYNATGKICGVWRKVPRIYKQLLREEKLWVALMDDKDGEATTGRVARYKALSTELLSAVLAPNEPCPACGGTAAVSIASASNSVHVTVAVAGLASKANDVETLVVRLETLETGASPSRVIEELVTVQKPQEVNVVEVRSVFEAQEMRLLLRGHVVLSVHAKRAPEVRLRGAIGPRIACDLFDSLVTTGDASSIGDGESSAAPPASSSALGMAWMYIGRSGSVHYRIRIRGVESKIVRATIESAGNAKANKKPRIVEDVTENASEDGHWINGTISRLAGKDLELLYEGELYVNIATERWPTSEIRGRIVPRLAGESHLATDSGPVLMNPVGNATGNHRAALGWVHVDNECNFHYDVNVASNSPVGSRSRDYPNGLTVLELVDIPRLSINEHGIHSGSGAPGASSIMLMDGSEPSSYGDVPYMPNVRLLEEFTGYQAENSVADLNKLSLARLDAGVAYLQITEAPAVGSGAPGAQFQGWITNVQVPGACLPFAAGRQEMGEGPAAAGGGYTLDRAQDDNNEIPMTSARCFYEGKLFEDGKAWAAEHDKCMMCSCQRGRVVCDPVVCPALSCGPSANIVHPTGDCCPMCENVTKTVETTLAKRGCYFDGDQKFHPAGSRWHPYLPPFGFSKCATCYCHPLTLKVECTKQTCPALNCPDSEAYRPDPMACCKQCPTAPSTTAPNVPPANKELLGEEAQARGEVDILSSGGCRFKGDVFENGEEWHPRIQPWGEMRCINCNCKDGKVKCKRKKCVKVRCVNGRPITGQPVDECCPNPCSEDSTTSGGGPAAPTPAAGKSQQPPAPEAEAKKKRTREGRARSSSSSSAAASSVSRSHRQPPHLVA